MFAYELHQARRADLTQQADQWRLAQQAKAARAERRAAARRSAARPAVRTDREAAESPTPGRHLRARSAS